MNNKGLLLVFSGPSGVGKGTVLKEYLKKHPHTAFSVSATTRKPRAGEIHGQHYFFLSREEFELLVENGGLLEHAQFAGNCYGTPREAVEQNLEKGIDVVLEIEVQGALQVKQKCPDALLVFVMPPSFEEPAPPVNRPRHRRWGDGRATARQCGQGNGSCQTL